MLPDEQTSPEQFAIYRRMTPEQRWREANRLYWSARKMKVAFIRNQHPDWTESQVEAEVREIFIRAQNPT